MRPEEARELGELAGEAAASVATQARQVHEGIAQRVFTSLGPGATVVRSLHDRLAEGAYAGARTLTGALVRSGAHAWSLTQPADAPSLQASTPGRLVVGALNGAWGDMLHRRHSALETPMTLRRGGRDVALDRDSLEHAFGDATPRLAVFAHGLGETDDAWRLRATRHVPYGDRLHSELGYTPLYVRYNSGLHVSQNGRRLAELLDELTANWPVEVTEITLVGHSMGGLLARSACHYASQGSWREKVRHVFMLGMPHRGAPLELAANAACHAISWLPETRAFAQPLKIRSAGIKDLGYGYVVDEDWHGHDPDAFWHNTGTEVPFLTSANHYFVCATLSREADAPLGRIIGDLLVLRASAWAHGGGGGERMQFPVDQYRHVGGASHFDLLNHPAIYDQIRRWITGERALPLPADRALPPVALASEDELVR